MRILLIIHHRLTADSGAPGTTMALAHAYETLGHDVTLLSYEDFPGNLPLHVQELVFPEFVSWWLTRHARHGFDVIDASSADAWLWGTVFRRRHNRPLLVTRSHGLEHAAHAERLVEAAAGRLELSWRYPLFYGGFRLWEAARSMRVADITFFLNEHDREWAVMRLGVPAERAHVVSNGIDRSLVGLPVLPMPSDGAVVRIAQVGTYSQRKGIAFGTPALVATLQRHPNVEVSFVGVGVPAAQVERDLPASVRERVHVVEWYDRSKLPQVLASHQIILFPTLDEGFGKALLEGMACGLAPVATDAPGPAEFVVDAVNGLVVPRRDQPAIEGALSRLILDPALLLRLRQAARDTAQRYSWSQVAEQRLALYQHSLLERGLRLQSST